MTVGKRILKLRTAAGLSQEELALRLEVSRQSVSKWETDAALPELDKLIKLADMFHVSLDELACRTAPVSSPESKPAPSKESALPLLHQRIIGYILLAASVIAGALLVVVADSDEERLALMAAVAVFVCSLICLFVRRGAWYWCLWVAFAPLILLTPFLVGMGHAVVASVLRLVFYAAMAVVARKRLYSTAVQVTTKRTAAIAAGWLVLIAMYVLPIVMRTVYDTWMAMFLRYLLIYAGIALMLTVTMLYIPKKP